MDSDKDGSGMTLLHCVLVCVMFKYHSLIINYFQHTEHLRMCRCLCVLNVVSHFSQGGDVLCGMFSYDV